MQRKSAFLCGIRLHLFQKKDIRVPHVGWKITTCQKEFVLARKTKLFLLHSKMFRIGQFEKEHHAKTKVLISR